MSLLEFHFIRPAWFLAAIPIGGLLVLMRRSRQQSMHWQDAIAPHLLPHLLVGEKRQQTIRPSRVLIAVLCLATIALAGPTWKREASPFADLAGPMAVAIDLSPTMNVTDIQPSRLERAKQKARDLLALRAGGRTALIAYAGSAHLVLPLTDDVGILETYLGELSTDIMPLPGKDTTRALAAAQATLADEPIPGTIVLFTDGVEADRLPEIVAQSRQSRDAVSILAIGTARGGVIPEGDERWVRGADGRPLLSQLEMRSLNEFGRQAGASIVEVSQDNRDVRTIARQSAATVTQAEALQSDRWQDFGYWLVYPIAALALLWFRRGWSTSSLLLAVLIWGSLTAQPVHAQESPFVDLWLTSDQQGRLQFDRGNYAAAAERFEDGMWKGVAHYATEDFEGAIAQFSRLNTPEAAFNLGNAYAHRGDYDNALASYERALDLRPNYPAATANRARVEQVLADLEEEPPEEQQKPGSTLRPDDVVIDETGERTDHVQEPSVVDGPILTEQLAEVWLRNVQTTPADFLRQKFAFQLQQSQQEGDLP
ncbi:MAG: VWA domain-containing protein [Synechococcus sp.]